MRLVERSGPRIGPRSTTILTALVLTLVGSTLVGPTTARGALRDDFEGSQSTWRDVGGDARYRIERHLRIAQDAHAGQGCEFLEIETSGDGSSIYLSYDVGRAPVI